MICMSADSTLIKVRTCHYSIELLFFLALEQVQITSVFQRNIMGHSHNHISGVLFDCDRVRTIGMIHYTYSAPSVS